MQIVGFEQTSAKFIEIFVRKNNYVMGNNPVVDTASLAINDSSDVLCFDLYLINIFAKSVKAERCKDVMFKLALYC